MNDERVSDEPAVTDVPSPPPVTVSTAPPEHAAHEHPVHEPARPSRSARAVLTAVGFVLLLAALAWIWHAQQDMAWQVAELAQRPIATPAPPSVDPARVAALEGRLHDLESHLRELQQRPPPTEPAPVSLTPLENRVAALESRGSSPSAVADERLAALDARLKALEQPPAEAVPQMSVFERAQRALEAGEPIGDLPGAPPALARFAHAKPPTEAALRLSFPAAAAAAQAASRPAEGKPFGERLWSHLGALVTVKQGERVVVGPPAAMVLGDAHAKLMAGDLAGAVATLDRLDPAAAAAMASWRETAQALLDARAALASVRG